MVETIREDASRQSMIRDWEEAAIRRRFEQEIMARRERALSWAIASCGPNVSPDMVLKAAFKFDHFLGGLPKGAVSDD